MLDSIASKRRSRRCLLWLASAIAAAPLVSVVHADQPSGNSNRIVPKRLPVVATDSGFSTARSVAPEVQPCSAELDELVDSWFADPSDEKKDNVPARWLRSNSSLSAAEVARRMVAQATREFEVGAWLSAETSAWDAVRWAAESADLAARERGKVSSPTFSQNLQAARDAIREARDFSGVYGPLNGEAIGRMAISHQTDILDNESVEGITATDASDRYLDQARVLLAPIARQSSEAAQGMDLLAAIYLRRADAKTLPSATALCLRRAALQGQPGNASLASRLGMHLADLGLFAEARWALEHSLAIDNDPTTANALVDVLRRSGQHNEAAQRLAKLQNQVNGPSRLTKEAAVARGPTLVQGSDLDVPEILELSPQEFASISQPVIPFDRSRRAIEAAPASASISSNGVNVSAASMANTSHSASQRSDQTASSASAQESVLDQKEKPGMIRRFLGSFKHVW